MRNRGVAGTRVRFLMVGNHLAADFANTLYSPQGPGGALRSWDDLLDFLARAAAIQRSERKRLRAMEKTDPHRCSGAFGQAIELRDVTRKILSAIEGRQAIRREWIEVVNRLLRSNAGAEELMAKEGNWRLTFVPQRVDPLRTLAPIARSVAELIAEGPRAPVRKCANPQCVLYFYDTSRTGRRRWCSMGVCGNRAKVAAHARRRVQTLRAGGQRRRTTSA